MTKVDDTTYVFPISGTTVEATDTVLSAGQVCSIENVSSVFIKRVEIGSTFTGGSVEETTVALLERATTNINAKVVTGRDNIKSLLDSNTDVNVLSAAVFGMGDELMLRDKDNPASISSGGHVDIYVKTQPVPAYATVSLTGTREGETWTVEIPSVTFPGAYGVTSVIHNGNIIDNLTHVMGYSVSVGDPHMSDPLHARYSQYQDMSITFESDKVDNTLTEAVFEVTVLYMPGISTLQDYLNGVNVRSYAFDQVAKAAVPVIVEAHMDIEYAAGITPPDLTTLQTTIADIINLKEIGTESLLSSEFIYGSKLAFPEGVVRMPLNLFARIYMPDGTQKYAFHNDIITVMEAEGIAPDNAAFFCFPNNLTINLTELS
jgi:hypothetical protein